MAVGINISVNPYKTTSRIATTKVNNTIVFSDFDKYKAKEKWYEKFGEFAK